MKIIQGRHYVTQGYGSTEFARSPDGQRLYKNFGGIHPGIDLGTGGVNLPVLSTCAGKVVRASLDGGWGNHVEILGEDGWRRQYAHLQSISVLEGATIKAGDKIGLVGTTGASTGVHLHYGHRKPKLLGGWMYRDPDAELDFQIKEARWPTKRLIRSKNPSVHEIYVWNGTKRFYLQSWETLRFFFSEDEPIEAVDEDIFSKLPTGDVIPLIK